MIRRSSPRATELGLLGLVGLITGGAYALASLGRSASLPANLFPIVAVLLGFLLVAHLGVRRLAPRSTGILLPLAGLLNGIGYVFIARLDAGRAAAQATWTGLAVAAFIGTLLFVRRARQLDRYRYTFALVGIALLLMPLLPKVGLLINGARLWVRVGPLSFQPGELAKIALAIFFTSYLVEKQEVLATGTRRLGPFQVPNLRHFGPVLAAWGVSLVVMTAERDLGSSLLFFALFVSMLWVATARGTYLGVGAALFSGGAFFAWTAFTHVQQRIRIWVNPWPRASGEGFQIVQALFAFGTGGLVGTGISLGGANRIPAAETDFIFAAIGEELGLLGTTAILVAFLLMVGTGLRIAREADTDFDKLLATGLTTIIGVQSFIILGGVIRLVPLTGITLPFVSYGGSSLVANYILLALLLRISDDSHARAQRMTGPVAADETIAA
ncbi:MAG TPA: FtsW/RodA/SpoVE family cell cycle protein [Acidimicrobiales bacterium]|nr:FtsW/RodA/SpoVE family cell cycle protein [Acidimicrobiales bacterium]